MKNREAQALFKESKLLYRERRYEESLEALQKLDARYPNTRNILYPIAKCLRRLARFEEAAAICDRLILEFDDERAKHMRKNVQGALDRANARTIAVAPNVPVNLDDDMDAGFDELDLGDLPPLDEEAETMHLPGGFGAKPVQQGRDVPWLYIGVGAVVAAFVLIGIIGAMSGGGSGDSSATPLETAAPVNAPQLIVSILVFSVFATLTGYCVSLYATLMITDKLPYDSFSDDSLLVFGYSLLGTLLTFVLPCIGYIVNLVLLRRKFGLGFIDFLVLIGIFIAVSTPLSFVSNVMFADDIAQLTAQLEAEAQQVQQ